MRYIGRDHMEHTGTERTGFAFDGHVQLAFEDIGDLFMRVLVDGEVTAGFDLNDPQGHLGTMSVVTGETGGEGFGGLVGQ